MHSSAEYKCWLLMKNRCYNPNSKDYAYAGAQGVRVCERWRSSFQSFYDDMGARPPGHFLQRIRTYGRIWAWKLPLGSQAARRAA